MPAEGNSFSELEAYKIAKMASQETLKEAFLGIGIDINDPTEAQKDFAFLRNTRTSTEAVKRQGIIATITLVTAAVLGLIWNALRGTP